MSSRIYQNVIVQMKEATDRAVGVLDPDGVVTASGELKLIGTKLGYPPQLKEHPDSIVVSSGGYTYKSLGHGTAEDYIIFTQGEDELAKTVCIMAAIAVSEAGIFFEENHDKRSFVKTIISENILPGDIFLRAKELRFTPDVARGVLVVRLSNASNMAAIDALQEFFPDKQNDYVITVRDNDIVIVKELPQDSDERYLTKLADDVYTMLDNKLGLSSVIGVGTPAYHLRDLAERYKQALIAIDIGKIFETGKHIISYENLGICRLIYQLPTTLCEIFLSEVFKRNPIESLDQETLFTIDKFFENSLNVSETARKLYVHRNTLVYRLDKLKKITGLDLREFDHAIIFKVALMVKKYLISQEM